MNYSAKRDTTVAVFVVYDAAVAEPCSMSGGAGFHSHWASYPISITGCLLRNGTKTIAQTIYSVGTTSAKFLVEQRYYVVEDVQGLICGHQLWWTEFA